MKRLTMLVVVGLLAAACGGDSGDEPTETTASDAPDTTATQEPADEPAATTTAAAAEGDDAAASTGGDASFGRVTVAGETYEFVDSGFPGLQCDPEAFGVAFIAALHSAEGEIDGVIGSLAVGVPFEGQEETAGIVPEVSASVGEVEWNAIPGHVEDGRVPEGSSQVDSYVIEGNTISGTATFYEVNSSYSGNPDDLIVETGTFEVTCVDG